MAEPSNQSLEEEILRDRKSRKTARPITFTTAQILSVAGALLVLAIAAIFNWIKPALAIGFAFLISYYSFQLGRKYDRDLSRLTRAAARAARDQERAKARAQAPLRSKIVQGFPDPLLMINASREVVEANAAARDLFSPTIVGKDLLLFIRTPSILEAIKETMTTGQPTEREFLFDKAVGRQFSLRAALVSNELAALGSGSNEDSETPYYVVLVFRDVTKIKMAERMRADFVANASHELRTPLTSLIGFIETLQGPAQSDEKARARFLAIMEDEAQRMVRVIDDLLSLSRIELDKHVSPTETVDPGVLIQGVGHTLAMALKDNGRAYNSHIEHGIPAVKADRDQIIQVLQNLVSNAIKYGHKGTEIKVRAKQISTSEIRIEVIDQGDGIPAKHLPRLTERFYRVDTARSRQLGGTGLGLAIVKHIIERHRGRLMIDSVEGKGTTIAFTLPIAQKNA